MVGCRRDPLVLLPLQSGDLELTPVRSTHAELNVLLSRFNAPDSVTLRRSLSKSSTTNDAGPLAGVPSLDNSANPVSSVIFDLWVEQLVGQLDAGGEPHS